MNTELDLKNASDLADAKLQVAEELGWPIALLLGATSHLYLSNWLLTIPAAVAGYLFATYKYRRESAVAEDQYYRAAGLGKYVGNRRKSDA